MPRYAVLIALQINNWNIDRLERLEELQLLENLKVEFASAIAEIKELNGYRDEILTVTENFYQIIRSNKNLYDINTLDSMLAITLRTPTYNIESGTQQLLFSSAKINIISNNELKDLLISWPSASGTK